MLRGRPLFRKNKMPKTQQPQPQSPERSPGPTVAPAVLETLQRLEKAGVQLSVDLGGFEQYTSEVVGVGRGAYFIDAMSPHDGDRRAVEGARARIETLLSGITYSFESKVLGKVQFLDELPAFKLSYPHEIRGERRRKSPRIDTSDSGASISFLRPFSCDAVVVNLSEGGLAFEYDADLGRLKRGAVIDEVLVELGQNPVFSVRCKIVGNLIAELGGLGLPLKYRASLAFLGLSRVNLQLIQAYLTGLKTFDFSI